LADFRRAIGDQRAAFRTINHELHSAIPLPASAENLQENFSSRLNKTLRRIVSPAAVGRRRLRVANVDGFGIANVLVFDIVAGRQDLQQVAAGDLLRSSYRGTTRSRHSFIANMSPAGAAAMALRVNPRASPAPARRRRHNLIAHRIALPSLRISIYGIRHCVNSNRGRLGPKFETEKPVAIAPSPSADSGRWPDRNGTATFAPSRDIPGHARFVGLPRKRSSAPDWWTYRRPAHLNSLSSPFASFRSAVSKPSVNQP
jgi:hypothetical protein